METKVLPFLAIFSAIFYLVGADIVDDKQALLDFLGKISNSRSLNWNSNSSVCESWIGITCNADKSQVIALRLPAVGLRGRIPPDTLSRLSGLQILSLRMNNLSGLFPSDFSKLGNLTVVYLERNQFSGPLPDNWSPWINLIIVDFSGNGFNGSIPSSISNLTRLLSLNLANNSLSGGIPNLDLPQLQQLNLEYNNLTGVVPTSLQRFPESGFVGNNVSFGSPNSPGPAVPLEPSISPQGGNKLSGPAVLGIAIGACVGGFVVIAVLMILFCSSSDSETTEEKSGKKDSVSAKRAAAAVEKPDKEKQLVFFEGCNYGFDLEDLLTASAEVLGKGLHGTTYKAALMDTTTVVVVKRLKEVAVTRKEFAHQMEVVGRIRHENVAPLRAYYCSKDEKLLVFDHFGQGSVSALLHGRVEGRAPLDWESRVKITIGTARGLATVHSAKLVHGNVKASNIFLNRTGFGCVSDVSLAPLMNPIPPPLMRLSGYRAPEITDTRKATLASDVYSFGVLLLELLTGKSPVHAMGTDEVVHLVRWVHSVVREEWTAEVFDVALLKYPNIEEEMVEMLQIGMACVVKVPDQRPKISDVVKMVEEIHRSGPSDQEIRSERSSSNATPTAVDVGPSSSAFQAQVASALAVQSQVDSSAAGPTSATH